MGLEQRIYDSQDLLVGEPEIIPPGHHGISTHRLTGHFLLPSGQWPDYYVDITAVCEENGVDGSIHLFNPVTGKPLELSVNGTVVRFNTRNDDGSLGTVEWSHVPD